MINLGPSLKRVFFFFILKKSFLSLSSLLEFFFPFFLDYGIGFIGWL